MKPSRRSQKSAALAAVAVIAAAGLAWQRHRAAASAEDANAASGSGHETHTSASAGSSQGGRHAGAAGPHRDQAARRRMLAKALIHGAPGQDGEPPDLDALSPEDLQGLLEALTPELAGQPLVSRVFCYQQVLDALQAKAPAAGLTALERLRASLPPEEIPQVWTQLTGIFLSSVRSGDLPGAEAWLREHTELFASVPVAPGQPAGSTFREAGEALALNAAHQDLDSGFRTLEDLGLPRTTILPALARQLDSAEDWTRLLAELHASAQTPGSSATGNGSNRDGNGTGPGSDDSAAISPLAAEVLTAANAKIGQMSAAEGRAWLSAAPFSQADLEHILTHIEAGPIQDPGSWNEMIFLRLTPSQAAHVHQSWEARANTIVEE